MSFKMGEQNNGITTGVSANSEQLIAAKRGEIQDVAGKIVEAIKGPFATRFNEKEVLLLFDGSTSRNKSYSSAFGLSDIDITVVLPKRLGSGNTLNMENFKKITDAIREAVIEVENKYGIYVVVSHNFPEEAFIEALAETTIRSKKVGDSPINMILLDCVLYPSFDAIISWANLRTDGLKFAAGLISKGELIYGDNDTREKLAKKLTSASLMRDLGEARYAELNKSIITAEKHIADTHVILNGNTNLPEQTLSIYALKRLKVVGNTIGNALIRLETGLSDMVGSWDNVLNNIEKLPDYFGKMVSKVNNIRVDVLRTGIYPKSDEIVELYIEAAEAIKKVRIEKGL